MNKRKDNTFNKFKRDFNKMYERLYKKYILEKVLENINGEDEKLLKCIDKLDECVFRNLYPLIPVTRPH